MNVRKNWAWAALVAAATASPAAAQPGGISSGGSTGGVGLGGGSGLTSSGLAGTLNSSNVGGGSGVGAGGLSTNRSGTGTGSQQPIATNGISPPTGQSRSSLDASNFLSGYYANPTYAGSAAQGGIGVTPGGFGTVLYGTGTGTTGATGARTGAAGGRTGTGTAGGRTGTGTTGFGATGATGLGGFGTGRTGAGGFGGLGGQGGTGQNGIVVPIPVQINYAAQIRFAAPPVAPARIQTDLRSALDNSTLIASGRGVQVITDDLNNVTLRGRVRDEDEARLIEGVVRLTPGVRAIQNELTFLVAVAPK